MNKREPVEIYLTFERFIEEYKKKQPTLTMGSLCYKFRHRETNGYKKGFIKDGKNRYVAVNEFWNIFTSQEGKPWNEKKK